QLFCLPVSGGQIIGVGYRSPGMAQQLFMCKACKLCQCTVGVNQSAAQADQGYSHWQLVGAQRELLVGRAWHFLAWAATWSRFTGRWSSLALFARNHWLAWHSSKG